MTGYDFVQYLLDTFGAIVLAAVLMAFFAYKVLEKYVHTKFDQRLGDLEREFQESVVNINSYHAISKETLGRAFQKKIEVYEQLLESVNKRARFINENPVHDEPDSEEDYLSCFLSIITIIENNSLYITSDLASKYDSWYQSAKPYIKASNDSEYEEWQHSFGTDEDREAAYYAGLPDKLTMMQETETEFQDLLKCIDQDIRDIRSSLERPMSPELVRSNRSKKPRHKELEFGE
jgi:hypothetical protein